MTSALPVEMAKMWSTFPIDASPRPVILLQDRTVVDGGFTTAAAKIAWLDGAIVYDTPLPAEVTAVLPARAGRRSGTTLTVTSCQETVAVFRCDRGPRELPAYRMRMTGLDGACLVLAPGVDVWWPPPEHEHRGGGTARIAADGMTVDFPAAGGALTQFHGVDFDEHDKYVVGLPVTSQRTVPPGTAVHLVRITGLMTGRLAAPLGGRVLLDAAGTPLEVSGRARRNRLAGTGG